MSHKLTIEEVLHMFNKLECSKNIEIVGEYQGCETPIKCRCNIHNIDFESVPNNFLRGKYKYMCPLCYKESRQSNTSEYINKLKQKNKQIVPLEEYIRANKKILHRCLICNREFRDDPNRILNKKYKCPGCFPSNNFIVIGVNDMWTTNPDMASLLLNREDGYRYMKSSSKKIDWKCPDCLSIIKNNSPMNVERNGLSCKSCSDGLSVPGKFMSNILNELKVNYESEKRFKWCKYKLHEKNKVGVYDFSFDINGNLYIVEVDGAFHQMVHSKSDYTIDDIRLIDSEKDRLAKENGYEMIRIDCKLSALEYMKNNIINSKLNTLFDLSNIDWNECFKKSLKSKAVEALALWNSDIKSTKEISELLKIHQQTACRYLKQFAKMNLCDYDPKISIKKSNKISKCGVAVVCVTTGLIFNTLQIASDYYNAERNNISSCCRGLRNYAGKLGDVPLEWKYVDDNHIVKTPSKPLSIHQYDINNDHIATYSSSREAERLTKVSHSLILKCCKGIYKSSHGYIWKYAS